jgi:hypothetical protein
MSKSIPPQCESILFRPRDCVKGLLYGIISAATSNVGDPPTHNWRTLRSYGAFAKRELSYAPLLASEARGLVRGHLPLPVILRVHLQRPHTKGILSRHFDVYESS